MLHKIPYENLRIQMIVQQGGGIEIKEGEKGPSNLWTFATVWLPKYIWNIFGCVAHRKLKANCSFEDDELRGNGEAY